MRTSMARLIVGLVFVGLVAGQYTCECSGNWLGPACDQCDASLWTGLDCDVPVIPNITILPCRHNCWGNGVCDQGVCRCNNNFAGEYCEECSQGQAGYPFCSDPVCEPSIDCATKGSCLPDVTPCGFDGCLDTEKCCTHQVTDFFGNVNTQKRCIDKEASCCGPATCAAPRPVCGDSSQGHCCPAQTTYCARRDENGALDLIRPRWSCCQPNEKCCEGECCSKSERCKEFAAPEEGWLEDPINVIDYIPNSPLPERAPDFGCTSEIFAAPAVIRAAFLPFALTVVLLLGFVSMALTSGFQGLLTIISLLLVAMSIFVLISPAWPFAVLVALSTFFAMGASSPDCTAEKRFVYALAFEAFVFIVLLGGLFMPALFFETTNDMPYFPLLDPSSVASTNSALAVRQLSAACAGYYGYYSTSDPRFLDWKQPPGTPKYFGVCSPNWIAALHFFMALSFAFYILLMLATGLRAVGAAASSAAPAQKQPAPATSGVQETEMTTSGEGEEGEAGKQKL